MPAHQIGICPIQSDFGVIVHNISLILDLGGFGTVIFIGSRRVKGKINESIAKAFVQLQPGYGFPLADKMKPLIDLGRFDIEGFDETDPECVIVTQRFETENFYPKVWVMDLVQLIGELLE